MVGVIGAQHCMSPGPAMGHSGVGKALAGWGARALCRDGEGEQGGQNTSPKWRAPWKWPLES
eukprot:1411093-Lingulodinium_polyedra.AAC.1